MTVLQFCDIFSWHCSQSFFNLIGLHFPGGGLPFESPVFGIAGYVILRRGRRPCMIFIHEMLNKKKKT